MRSSGSCCFFSAFATFRRRFPRCPGGAAECENAEVHGGSLRGHSFGWYFGILGRSRDPVMDGWVAGWVADFKWEDYKEIYIYRK